MKCEIFLPSLASFLSFSTSLPFQGLKNVIKQNAKMSPKKLFFFLMQRKASSHCLLSRKKLCLVLCLEVNSKCNKDLDVKLKCKAVKKEIVHGMKNFHRRDFLRHFFKNHGRS